MYIKSEIIFFKLKKIEGKEVRTPKGKVLHVQVSCHGLFDL